MMRSLYSGVSGLKTHQTKMDVIGNNIANVNTVAFKSSSVTFGELMYQTTSNASGPNADTGRGGINAKQIGLGVQMGATNVSITTTGATQTTGNPFDLKITGDSFFIVNDGQSNYFTRAGAFYVDAVGNLAMTSTGYNVMGWQVGNDGNIIQNTVSPIKVLSAEHMFSQPEATTLGTASGVLDKADPNLTSNNGKILSLSVYDDLGYEYTAKFSITPFKNATTTTQQVTNTSTTYTKLPTIKEWTNSEYTFRIMANDQDQNGSEITTYTTPGKLYDALVKYSSDYDAATNPHGHGLSDKAVIDLGSNAVLNELATIMGLGTGTIPTKVQFMNDPDLVGKKVRVGKTDVTSYTVEENGSSTPLEGIQKETLEALKAAGVIENNVYYAPHKTTMEDLVGTYLTKNISYEPAGGKTWADLVGTYVSDETSPGAGDYQPISPYSWTDLMTEDLVQEKVTYDSNVSGKDMAALCNNDLTNGTLAVLHDDGGGNYSAKNWTLSELVGLGLLEVDADSPGGYKIPAPAKHANFDSIEKLIGLGLFDAKQDTYTPVTKQDFVRYEKRYYDGKSPDVTYTIVNTSGTAPGTKTTINDDLKAVTSAQMGIFLGAGKASDITIYDTNEPITKVSYIEGQYSVKLFELIDIANGKTSVNFDILGDTSRDLMFDTNDGKFRYIGAEGQTAYDLHLSALGGNFKDINIDFSTVKNVSNEGTSTIGMKAGDEEGVGAGKLLGALKGVQVDSNGMIYGSYDNGNTELLGQIAVTEFANAAGLEKVGDNLYQTTLNSGEFDGIGRDISSLSGSMTTGVLEMSNVDLSAEFTDMITTQRGFQANSRIITTSDTLLEELINLKR